MKTNSIVKIIITVLCITLFGGCKKGSDSSQAEPKKDAQVMAEVNGKAITTDDFEGELKNLPEYLKSMSDSAQGRKEMLDTMVVRELILQQASKDGLDKGPEVAKKLEDLKKRLIVEAYLKKKVESDTTVSDEELKKFYEQNKDKFKADAQIRASHILVSTEQEAKDLLSKLKAGGNFEELAKGHSKDSSAAKGGDIGWFGKGAMVPPFEKALMALKEGQLSDVVRTDYGYHIIKLTGKRPAGLRPFDEVKEQIKGALMPAKQQELFLKIKEELKKSAKINIKEDVLSNMGAKKSEAKPSTGEAKPAAGDKK